MGMLNGFYGVYRPRVIVLETLPLGVYILAAYGWEMIIEGE